MKENKLVVSAGILLDNRDNEYLLVNPNGGTTGGWGIPKGKLDAGEDIKAAAMREVYEETGLILDPNNPKNIISQYEIQMDNTPFFHYALRPQGPLKSKYDKDVYAYRASANVEIVNFPFNCISLLSDGRPEISEFAWFTLEEALKSIVKSQKGMIEYLLRIEETNKMYRDKT